METTSPIGHGCARPVGATSSYRRCTHGSSLRSRALSACGFGVGPRAIGHSLRRLRQVSPSDGGSTCFRTWPRIGPITRVRTPLSIGSGTHSTAILLDGGGTRPFTSGGTHHGGRGFSPTLSGHPPYTDGRADAGHQMWCALQVRRYGGEAGWSQQVCVRSQHG
jgi:hypothetical protein